MVRLLKGHDQCWLGGIMMDDVMESLPHAEVGVEVTYTVNYSSCSKKNFVKRLKSCADKLITSYFALTL